MGSRSTNLRTKVVALLLSLTALWAFAAWVTLREGVNLLWVQTLNTKVFEPSEPLLLELQVERRASVAYLGKPVGQQREVVDAERQKTGDLAAAFEKSARDWQSKLAGSAELEQRIDESITGLDELEKTRAAIDTRSIDRGAAATAFTNVIDSIFRVYDSLGKLDDQEIAKETAALIELNRVRELVSQEDALLAGVYAAGRATTAEYGQFAQLVGAQRFIAADTVTKLPAAERAHYDRMASGGTYARVHALEERVILNGRAGSKVPVEAGEWRDAAEPAMAELHDIVAAGGQGIVTRATPVAIWVIARVVLAAGLGLLAVIASIVVSVTTARALVAQLERLRTAARQLAEERLPNVVNRLGRGEDVDVAAEAPPLDFGEDEIGQVGRAFNLVQETAVRTAVEQAELRRSVRDVFLSLARRTQALVHRQLTLLDTMERRENEAEELEDLFRVDHLATRMRRNAENLIVLSGSTPGRAWRRNVPMIDVIRGAVAEVEDYARVTVQPTGSVGLAGRAVGDIIHLLAELIENALSFSPPHTGVEIRGQMVANGFVIEIEDRGLGMSEEDRAAANEQIASQQEFNLANATRLGLYVVSRLTERHGVRTQLKESPYGGTTAIVLIPTSLVTEGAQDAEVPPAGRPEPRQMNAAVQADERGRAGDRPERAVGAVAVANPPAAWPPIDARPPLIDARPPIEPPSASPAIPQRRPVLRPEPEPEPTPDAGGGEQPPADAASAPETTPSGLPFRVRQASLAPPLRESTAGPEQPNDEEEAPRPPDQVRRMMSSYQTGTRRGRSDAARLIDEDSVPLAQPANDDSSEGGDQPLT